MIKAGALAILVYTIPGTGSSVQLQQFSDDVWFYSAFKKSSFTVSILLVAPWSAKVFVLFHIYNKIKKTIAGGRLGVQRGEWLGLPARQRFHQPLESSQPQISHNE